MKPFFKPVVLVTFVIALAGVAAAQSITSPVICRMDAEQRRQDGHEPEQADAAYPAVLNEYGFAEAETASYSRPDGRKLTVKAARFKDATGAYGAFTFYRTRR